MAQKLYEYEGFVGRLHGYRDECRERWKTWLENREASRNQIFGIPSGDLRRQSINEDFSHVYRKKTRLELIRISAAVMGIEFSYAAETAFVSPTLLKIGVEHQYMTLVWALSPLIGFFVTPVLGSISDRCPLKLGRRRPFILAMSLGILLGLLLIPNGEDIGYSLGDERPPNITTHSVLPHRTSALDLKTDKATFEYKNSHPWGIFFTILGTVLLDFDADACQSPARSYLLDVTVTEDHAKGLSTFTVMAGLGGFFGYALGGIDWHKTSIGILLGGNVRAVFTLITIIFLICVTLTITSFKEIPLSLLEMSEVMHAEVDMVNKESEDILLEHQITYGTTDEPEGISSRKASVNTNNTAPPPNASLLMYLESIVCLPRSLRVLCLTNLFCWMAHVCYSLYFTDFVGEAVFGGDPKALEGSHKRELYEKGIRFGCWGMSMYSLSCACYSLVIEKLIFRFSAKRVYVGGLLIYSTGMMLMGIARNEVGVIVFSWAAGVMYSTLFTMPFLLVAHYHSKGVFEMTAEGTEKISGQIRGLGTDVAVVSSMVFLAQLILSVCMGAIVTCAGTTTAVVIVASCLGLCGALTATQVSSKPPSTGRHIKNKGKSNLSSTGLDLVVTQY